MSKLRFTACTREQPEQLPTLWDAFKRASRSLAAAGGMGQDGRLPSAESLGPGGCIWRIQSFYAAGILAAGRTAGDGRIQSRAGKRATAVFSQEAGASTEEPLKSALDLCRCGALYSCRRVDAGPGRRVSVLWKWRPCAKHGQYRRADAYRQQQHAANGSVSDRQFIPDGQRLAHHNRHALSWPAVYRWRADGGQPSNRQPAATADDNFQGRQQYVRGLSTASAEHGRRSLFLLVPQREP